MKSVVKYLFILLAIIFIVYLSLPAPNFPSPLKDAIRSGEPADLETNLRREYYTDMFRQDAMAHYKEEFMKVDSILYPTYRLNYPPEESYTKIRDQTRSTYLEEIVHPFRESIYVNGFEPKLDKDKILIDEKRWNSKVIVRYYPSNLITRVLIGVLTLIIIYLVYQEWEKEFIGIIRYLKDKRWIFR